MTMSNKMMECTISGVGAWGPGFNNWSELEQILSGVSSGVDGQAPGPKPEVIPANERRRAPLLVRLAVESSGQAIQHAGIESADLGCVFSSGLGDTDITDYMCRTLASASKQLSPTKFHNSVHNAAAGYWTISTHCMESANSIAGFQLSSPLGILEAVSQSASERRPILLTLFDAPVCEVLKKTLVNRFPFAASIVIQPEPIAGQPRLAISIEQRTDTSDSWPALANPNNPILVELYETNPAARMLALLDLLIRDEANTINMPLSAGTSLAVRRL